MENDIFNNIEYISQKERNNYKDIFDNYLNSIYNNNIDYYDKEEFNKLYNEIYNILITKTRKYFLYDNISYIDYHIYLRKSVKEYLLNRIRNNDYYFCKYADDKSNEFYNRLSDKSKKLVALGQSNLLSQNGKSINIFNKETREELKKYAGITTKEYVASMLEYSTKYYSVLFSDKSKELKKDK